MNGAIRHIYSLKYRNSLCVLYEESTDGFFSSDVRLIDIINTKTYQTEITIPTRDFSMLFNINAVYEVKIGVLAIIRANSVITFDIMNGKTNKIECNAINQVESLCRLHNFILVGNKNGNITLLDMNNQQSSSKLISNSYEIGVIYLKRIKRNIILIGLSDEHYIK